MKKTLSGIILIFIFCTGTIGFGIDSDEIIRKAKEKYQSIDNFSAEFTQIFKWKLAGENQENHGKIILKSNDLFRIETKDQLIVSDGKTLWTYSSANNQVIIDDIKNTEGNLLPSEIFLKFTEEYRPLHYKEENLNNSDCYVIFLKAKDDNRFIKEMKVWIDKKEWFTFKIEHVDINENITSYLLNKVQINQQISNNQFKFELNDNMEVIDMR